MAGLHQTLHRHPQWTPTTVVGVVNPDAPYKVVIEAHVTRSAGSCTTSPKTGSSTCRRGQRPPNRPVQAREHPHENGVVPGLFGWFHKAPGGGSSTLKNIFYVGAKNKEKWRRWASTSAVS